MGEDRELDGVVTYVNGEPFEGLKDATLELEPANPDDLPEAPELPELTFTLPPESVAALIELIKAAGEAAAQAFKQLVDGLKNVAAIAAEKASKLIEAEMYYANENSRWWHLYKHAKKARTRKKYRRLLMKQLLKNLKEANT